MTESIELTIDDRRVTAKKGSKVLQAALDAGIYIPNLCYLPDAELPFGGCRLCYVTVEGKGPVTACTQPVMEGMVVRTDAPEAQRLRRTAFRLILAYHDLDCRNCWKNKRCELQKLAPRLKVKLKTPEDFRGLPDERLPLDTTNPYVTYDPNRCVLCGKCVQVCEDRNKTPLLDFAFRGIETRLTMSLDAALVADTCPSCGECAAVCPTAALEPCDALKSRLQASASG